MTEGIQEAEEAYVVRAEIHAFDHSRIYLYLDINGKRGCLSPHLNVEAGDTILLRRRKHVGRRKQYRYKVCDGQKIQVGECTVEAKFWEHSGKRVVLVITGPATVPVSLLVDGKNNTEDAKLVECGLT